MRIILPIFLILNSFFVFSQRDSTKVYRTSVLKESILLATGISTLGLGYISEEKIAPLTENQISSLSISQINSFDRSATHQHNTFAKNTSDILLLASISAPLLLMTKTKMRKEKYTIGLMSLEVFCLSYGLTSVIKTSVQRTRPYVYNPTISLDDKQKVDARLSYLSGHTSVTAGLCFFSAKVFHDMSDNKTAKVIVWTTASLYPAITGFCRYKAGQHFPTDIISGYVLGALVGIAIPELHKTKKNLQFSPIISSQHKGFLLQYKF